MSLVSIIIPVYNVENYLDRCLESIVNQTMKTIEIILVNDGSTDKSGEKCKIWANKDRRIKYFDQENKGQSAARNVGFFHATSKYIMYMDSDDYANTHLVEKLYHAVTINNCDFGFCGIKVLESDETKNYDVDCQKNLFSSTNVYDFKELFFIQSTSPCAKIYKRQCLLENNILFPENLYYEDILYTKEYLLVSKKVIHISEYLYFYDRRNQISTTNNALTIIDTICILNLLNDFLKNNNLIYHFYNEFKIYCQKTIFASYHYLKLKKDISKKENYLNDFKNFYHQTFIQNPEIENYKIGILGSYNSKASLQSLFIDRDNIIFHYMNNSIVSMMSTPYDIEKEEIENDNLFKKTCVYHDFKREFIINVKKHSKQVDYLLIDFLEERFGVVEANKSFFTNSIAYNESIIDSFQQESVLAFGSSELTEKWKSACISWMNEVEKYFPHEKIILNEMYLCEQYGNSIIKHSFDHISEIQQINDTLKLYYDFFKLTFPNIKVVATGRDENYCDEWHTYGCDCVNKNQYAYLSAADKIYNIMMNRKSVAEL